MAISNKKDKKLSTEPQGHWWYDGRLFRPVKTTGTGDVSSETIFRYKQKGAVLSGQYSGGKIILGKIIGLVSENGHINMRYQHVTSEAELMTGICRSQPQRLPNGKLRLHERWQWTCGDQSTGTSILEEI